METPFGAKHRAWPIEKSSSDQNVGVGSWPGLSGKKKERKRKKKIGKSIFIYFYEIIKCKHPRRPTWYFTDLGFGTTAAIEGCDKKNRKNRYSRRGVIFLLLTVLSILLRFSLFLEWLSWWTDVLRGYWKCRIMTSRECSNRQQKPKMIRRALIFFRRITPAPPVV